MNLEHSPEAVSQEDERPHYETLLGRNFQERTVRAHPVILEVALTSLGPIHHWTRAFGKEYMHYGFRLDTNAPLVNLHVYGDRRDIESLIRTQEFVICELQLVLKTLPTKRQYILANFYLARRHHAPTHTFEIKKVPAGTRDAFLHTTKDMGGVGILVRPLP